MAGYQSGKNMELGMNKEQLESLLCQISKLRAFCEIRCFKKMDATKIGFGKHNIIESIAFYPDGVTVTVIDSGYDLRDTSSVSLSIDEILMTDEEWKNHLIKLKEETDIEREKSEKKRKWEEQQKRKSRYLELKKEFEEDNI